MPTPPEVPPSWLDDRHAWYAGWVLGLARLNGLPVEPVVIAGNYTDRLRLLLATSDGEPCSVELVVPPPPADWGGGS